MDNLLLDDGRCAIDLLIDQKRVRMVNQLREWEKCQGLLRPMVKALDDLGADFRLDDDINVTITGDKNKLASAIKIMYEVGYRITGGRPQKGDTAWSTFLHSSQCKFRIWFNFSSTMCRRIQVGTKTVEQPIYETVCDQVELPALPEEESPDGLLTSAS